MAKRITNTEALGERGWTLGANPRAIEKQEAAGQQELCADSALPTEGLDAIPAEWGIVVIGPRAGDSLFSDVRLPAGWRLEKTDHDMWSLLKDDAGVERARVFYKAAYYDRRAAIYVPVQKSE